MVLFVHLNHTVLLVVVRAGGEEIGGCQTAAQKYAHFAGRGLATGTQECRGIVTTFGRVGIGFCGAEAAVVVEVVIVVVKDFVDIEVVVGRETGAGIIVRGGGIGGFKQGIGSSGGACAFVFAAYDRAAKDIVSGEYLEAFGIGA